MKPRFIIILVFALLPARAIAQFTGEHAAMSNLRKGKWEKAKSQLAKSIRKDSLNPSAHYSLSIYFFTPANPDFQIDSAYRYVMLASSDFQYANVKQREKLKKIPIDSMILVKQRQRIDSAAFERAKTSNTESGYIDFLKRFPMAVQQTQAIELRDEVAYLNALKENTFTAFLNYLEKYPESSRATEAKSRYEKLLFEAKTKDKKLASYESFLSSYPSSPYRKEVEKQIFEIATASGEAVEFERLLKKYPQSSKVVEARNILYHLLKDDEQPIPRSLLNDSIQKLQQLEKYYLVPFFKDGGFGFMNENGEEIIRPAAKQIKDDYLCGNITDELLVFDTEIVARNNAVVFKGDISAVTHIGKGFLKVTTLACVKAIHYSGLNNLTECFQDVKIISGNYLAVKKENRWAVSTLTGRMLTDYVWDDIQQIDDIVVLKKSGKYKLVRENDLAKAADQLPIPFSQEFDDVKGWSQGKIWVKSGREQGVINQNLKEWIKIDLQEIEPTFFGAVARASLGYKLYDKSSTPSQQFVRVAVNQPWVAAQQDGSWHLIDPVTKQVESPAFDSVMFNGPFAIGMKHDSVRIYLTKKDAVDLIHNSKIQFLPGRDSLFFLLVEDAEKKTIYDSKGKQLFVTTFDRIEYNNEGFFTVFKKDKRGLIGLNGKVVVQPEYDALGSVNKGVVQTLKAKKFGLLDVVRRKEIKPEYEKNLVPYNASVLIASKKGLNGLVGWDGKVILPFEYEEILYWNDSSALVKKNFNWIFYNFIEHETVIDQVKKLKKVLDTDQEKILIVQQENNYGVISNRKGVIIPTTFTDIVNLGSATVPLYFTEKHVEEASIFVVIYYNKNGIQLRRQVFEIEDYERIYCSDN
ncbi:MAG TPA: WG repeat-containing protein [Cyclobacteriaceae bacterium]|nr:WG repeat-containing protein [Cyclobacteriaceae bacterium]